MNVIRVHSGLEKAVCHIIAQIFPLVQPLRMSLILGRAWESVVVFFIKLLEIVNPPWQNVWVSLREQ